MSAGLQIRVHIGKPFSLFLIQNICYWYSKVPSHLDVSAEHAKQMFKLMDKKIYNFVPYFLSGPMVDVCRPPDQSAYWKTIFFISNPKHMLWVLKRTVSMRRFF